MVSERTGLRGATSCARYGIPAFGNRLIRPACTGIAIDDCPATSLSQIDRGSCSRIEPKAGYQHSGKVSTGAVILRYGQVGRQIETVMHGVRVREKSILRNRVPLAWISPNIVTWASRP